MSPTDNNKNWFEVAILDKRVFINYLIFFFWEGGVEEEVLSFVRHCEGGKGEGVVNSV